MSMAIAVTFVSSVAIAGKVCQLASRTPSFIPLTVGSGICYDELYYQCMFCRIFVCENCHEKHPSSHSRELVQMISKKSDSKSSMARRSCLGCSTNKSLCLECQECNATFCEECFQQKAADHDHRIFFSLEAPYHQIKLNSGSSQACCAKPAISHCTWCLKCKLPSFVLAIARLNALKPLPSVSIACNAKRAWSLLVYLSAFANIAFLMLGLSTIRLTSPCPLPSFPL